MPKLGVNIDHVATLRQLRKSDFPDILRAAQVCEKAGADSIVVHLREDRRHIQEKDVRILRRYVKTRLNLEMATAEEIVAIACEVKPDQVTLVPEKRQELTTEGGLDVIRHYKKISRSVQRLKKSGIEISAFIEPDFRQITAVSDCGIGIVEFHTGRYADCSNNRQRAAELVRLKKSVSRALDFGLTVNAGHGLDYDNVGPVARIEGMHELNIGYSIICASIFCGLEKAVRRMKKEVA